MRSTRRSGQIGCCTIAAAPRQDQHRHEVLGSAPYQRRSRRSCQSRLWPRWRGSPKADQFGVRQIELYHNAEGKVYCLINEEHNRRPSTCLPRPSENDGEEWHDATLPGGLD